MTSLDPAKTYSYIHGTVSIGKKKLEHEEEDMTVKPLGDRVLLKAEAAEQKTKSGLYIPETAQEKTQTAVVIAVGEDETIKVKAGDRVMYDKYAGTTVKIDGAEHLIVHATDLIAVLG